MKRYVNSYEIESHAVTWSRKTDDVAHVRVRKMGGYTASAARVRIGAATDTTPPPPNGAS